ncbi:rhodanese-like domain-containing protein [Clostridium bovifaecis]|uniref:Rhodanese-like domain-containing protein n=1 Tax=Clostridium bovifaecis TaxID=2184719 RepID=A0A6I6F6L1_9CLOT|nr:rhodanese-like domain-containing protein [Clostridium bovifaecis]
MIYIIAVILLVGLFSGCGSRSVEINKEGTIEKKIIFSSITPEEAKKRLDSKEEIILIDVRSKEEYESGHIEGAMLIPVDTIEIEAEKKLKDKEVPIFVYCRSGNRSAIAANILASLEYKNVYDLGGINDWPYEIVK